MEVEVEVTNKQLNVFQNLFGHVFCIISHIFIKAIRVILATLGADFEICIKLSIARLYIANRSKIIDEKQLNAPYSNFGTDFPQNVV